MLSRSLRQLISKPYRRELATLHRAPRGFGGKGHRWADDVEAIARRYNVRGHVLDYGCGRNSLAEELRTRRFKTRSYDPAIKLFAGMPKPADMVVCCDVLEHVEPETLEGVLSHIADLIQVVGFFVVSTVETAKTLSDGRQAHISLHPREWWIAKFGERFRIRETLDGPAYRPEKQVVAVVVPK